MPSIWRRDWHNRMQILEWDKEFTSFDHALIVPAPPERMNSSTYVSELFVRQYLKTVTAQVQTSSSKTPLHLRFGIQDRKPADGWYPVELHSIRSSFWKKLNTCLSDSPLRLRTTWYVGRRKIPYEFEDLTNSKTGDYQLSELCLGLGFGPVGLVDL